MCVCVCVCVRTLYYKKKNERIMLEIKTNLQKNLQTVDIVSDYW